MENKYEEFSKSNPRGALSLEFSEVLGSEHVANHILKMWHDNELRNMSEDEKYKRLRKDFQNYVDILSFRTAMGFPE